jgi:hypothetical protein
MWTAEDKPQPQGVDVEMPDASASQHLPAGSEGVRENGSQAGKEGGPIQQDARQEEGGAAGDKEGQQSGAAEGEEGAPGPSGQQDDNEYEATVSNRLLQLPSCFGLWSCAIGVVDRLPSAWSANTAPQSSQPCCSAVLYQSAASWKPACTSLSPLPPAALPGCSCTTRSRTCSTHPYGYVASVPYLHPPKPRAPPLGSQPSTRTHAAVRPLPVQLPTARSRACRSRQLGSSHSNNSSRYLCPSQG